ncbi:MAG: carboxypeptidase-like regulatory domain-containing protein [Huintestinicola sp.]
MNNSNDINNMANRYKEEMMKLYRKANRNNTAQSRDIYGTVIDSTSTFYSSSSEMKPIEKPQGMNGCSMSGQMQGNSMQGNSMQGNSMQGTMQSGMSVNMNVPVQCDCRFPSAENIINCLAGTPMPLPADENTPGTVVGTYSADKTADAPMTRRVDTSMNNGADMVPNEDIGTNGIFFASIPSEADIVSPDQSVQEGEIIPDFELPPDIDADDESLPTAEARFRPSPGWISLTGDNSWGFLQLEIFSDTTDQPIAGAVVTVKRVVTGGVMLNRVIVTNRRGRTPTIALPAPSGWVFPFFQSGVKPFAEYQVSVRASGYYSVRNIKVPIYAGVKFVQPVSLIPYPSYGTPIQPRNDSSIG